MSLLLRLLPSLTVSFDVTIAHPNLYELPEFIYLRQGRDKFVDLYCLN